MRSLFLIFPLGFAAWHGCVWGEFNRTEEPSTLPAVKLAEESVILEVAFARFLPEDDFPASEVWNQIDEQIVSLEERKELWAKGLRVGVVGWQLPAVIQDRLAAQNEANQQLDTPEIAWQKRMQLRPDKPGTAICYPHRDKVVLLQKSASGGVVGKTYRKARCQIEVRAYPNDEGKVKLSLTPEILHGDEQKRWVGEDGNFRFDSGQGQEHLADSNISVEIGPGQTLLVTCTEPAMGLGKSFFTNPVDSGYESKVLLIRLAQISQDAAFASPAADDIFED